MNEQDINLRITIPPFYSFLAKPMRYKSIWGGRGAGRSWSVARILIGLAAARKMRVLATREFQTSIKDSVHQLLTSQIDILGLSSFYEITRDSIRSTVGSEFIFKGLRADPAGIKSLEGIDVAWIEEAQTISSESWEVLIPTIRKEGSELILTWNTGEIKDPTYQRFVVNPPDDCISVKATWRDNPYFPEVLRKEKDYLQRVDPESYDWVWEGNPKSISDACVFRNKFVSEDFEAPRDARFYHGSDFGFSKDPTTLVRCYINDGDLWVDYESYGVGVELDEIPELYGAVPTYKEWKIFGDNSRPETISYLHKKHGLRIEAADKGKGSVEDGIAFIKKFPKIHIHPRCKHTLEEMKLYAYKQDARTDEVLPILIDKNNHCMDALRYALYRLIKGGTDWAAAIG